MPVCLRIMATRMVAFDLTVYCNGAAEAAEIVCMPHKRTLDFQWTHIDNGLIAGSKTPVGLSMSSHQIRATKFEILNHEMRGNVQIQISFVFVCVLCFVIWQTSREWVESAVTRWPGRSGREKDRTRHTFPASPDQPHTGCAL